MSKAAVICSGNYLRVKSLFACKLCAESELELLELVKQL